ncbi:hypothetical protein NLJ89_g6328 [Agrocybe chaxingu]|uniref:EXPERA domain-containing protein n=1 Tax=Agrocybe chaxingu TaxID=84603 RepID=A0A9W8K5S1_9AGAR|nr:hypothetical protein NLJ89_g6328 [Agrocybe chaxingu]
MLVNYEKQSYKREAALPLSMRPLDLVYFTFFAIHLPASLIIDLQYIYPPSLVPGLLRNAVDTYIFMSRDPLIGGVFEAFGDSTHLIWFKTFLVLEAVFQIPVFVIGLRGLYHGSRKIYPLLALYGASSATTTLACLAVVLITPETTTHTLAQGAASVSSEQRLLLLSSYVPFFVIPFMMAVDMGLRVSQLIQKGIKAEEEEKWK